MSGDPSLSRMQVAKVVFACSPDFDEIGPHGSRFDRFWFDGVGLCLRGSAIGESPEEKPEEERDNGGEDKVVVME